MDSLFEPSYSDPFDSSSPSFFSFSSFADLTSIPELDSDWLSTWDSPDCPSGKSLLFPLSAPCSDTSAPSPSSSYPFQIISSAFEPLTPGAGDIGIFHTPIKGGPQKLSLSDINLKSSQQYQHQTQTLNSHRSTESSDSSSWEVPITPALTTRSSADSVAYSTSSSSNNKFSLSSDFSLNGNVGGGFSWDDASTTLSTSSFTTPVTPTPTRVASNPSLGAAGINPNKLKNVASMPALQEEDQASSSFSWFDAQAAVVPTVEAGSENLLDDFDWAFGDLPEDIDFASLAEIVSIPVTESSPSMAVPAESTIFAAFKEQPVASSSKSTMDVNPSLYAKEPLVWINAPTQDVAAPITYTMPQNFTIDPMAVMGAPSDAGSRPTSAPQSNGMEGSAGLLSVSINDDMYRSHTDPGYGQTTIAPPPDLFSYAPQQFHQNSTNLYASPALIQPASIHASSGPVQHPGLRRAASHGLTIQVNAPTYSTYSPNGLPTPQSANYFTHERVAPHLMNRTTTQPLPMTRKLSGMGINASHAPLPAHMVRAHGIVQLEEAKEEAKRQELRAQAAARRVGMAEASVMQPSGVTYHQPAIVGWSGPSNATSTAPNGFTTNAPPMTVHPPPMYSQQQPAQQPHRVHPPPCPPLARPIARLPSPGKVGRKPSNNNLSSSPSKRSPSGKRKNAAGGGGFSWGEATFINFTSDDAEKLLTGVAPSGSQSKRKREEDAAKLQQASNGVVDEQERAKRSRSDE